MNYATDASPILVDIETAPLPNARDFIDPPDLDDVTAPANYKDPVKIAAYIEQAKIDRLADHDRAVRDRGALDWNLCRIVAIGWWKAGLTSVRYQFDGDGGEADALAEFWSEAKHRTVVGFKVREFDIPTMLQRSLYLGVPHRRFDLGRFARGSNIIDLYDLLTFNDLRRDFVMRRTVKAFARRFGLPVDDDVSGADIPALVEAGDWEKVRSHVESDVLLELALARRLGVIEPARVEVAEAVI